MPITSFSQYRFTHLGMDVHRDSISVAVLAPDAETPEVDKVFNDEDSVRRLVRRLGDPTGLRACYEAGPTGYGLHRQLVSLGVRCDVVASALIPRVAGDRVKTDTRDARRLARLHRMGELVAIRVPSEAEEGVRDLLRAREDLVIDRRRARQRLSAFLLRHGQVWRAGDPWTLKHLEWLTSRRFDDRAVQATYDRYRAVVTVRDADVAAVEADLGPWFDHELFFDRARRLPRHRPARCADLGRRGVRLAPVRVGASPHELLRAGAFGTFLGEHDAAGSVDQDRQHPRAPPARRVRVGLPASRPGDEADRTSPRGRAPRHHRPGLGGAAAPHPTLQSPRRSQAVPQRRCRGDRPRTRRVRVGRDDRVTNKTRVDSTVVTSR